MLNQEKGLKFSMILNYLLSNPQYMQLHITQFWILLKENIEEDMKLAKFSKWGKNKLKFDNMEDDMKLTKFSKGKLLNFFDNKLFQV